MLLEIPHKDSRKPGAGRWLIGALLLVLVAGEAMANGMGHVVGHHGWVMARSMVLDENNQPILVEYNDQGEEERELELPGQYQDRVNELEVFSARSYRRQKQRLDAFRNKEAPPDARLLPRDQVKGNSFPLAGGEGSVTVRASDLNPGTRSVLVQGRSNTLTDNVEQFILREYSFDFTQSTKVGESARSVVVNRQGQVVATSPYTVAPRVGFYGNENEAKSGSRRFDPQSDEIFGPVSGVPVFANGLPTSGASDRTDSDGRYSFSRFMPCIPGGMTFVTNVQARLDFTSFNPLDEGNRPYYLQQRSFNHCSWTPVAPTNLTAASLKSQGAFESAPNQTQRVNLFVDVMMLTGEMAMRNPPRDLNTVRIEDTTRYGSFEFREDKAAPGTWYDFDNDGAADRVVIGKLTENSSEEEVFVEDENGSLQGVYFSSTDEGPEADQQPDIVRLLQENRERRVAENTGMLRSITREDLQNTDLLVFRAATGELIVERQGLSDDELGAREIGVGDEGKVGYRLLMRGPQGSGLGAPNITTPGSFKDWATDYQLEEPFRSKDSFHLQPGEWVEVVAINRTTGYVGTQRVQLTSAADPANPASKDLSVRVDEITLRPPNLRVWAERDYTVEKGAQAGEDREGQIIGSEGSSLQSDDRIIVHTEWLNHDGSALPEGLSASNGADFGLTGRLAKVSDTQTLQADGFNSDLAEFPIRPGKQKQILKFGGDEAPPEHYYLHVIGKAKSQECQSSACADFDTTGSEAGLQTPFDTRPRYVTPFLTPHYDEKTDWLAFNEYRRQKQDPSNSKQDLAQLQRPKPTYVWKYRPEYQFSRFQLAVTELNRTRSGETNAEPDKRNILDDPAPTLGSGDELLEIAYSLIEPEYERLAPIDGDQTLVLGIGGDETLVELGRDQRLELADLEHLDRFQPEDLLSLKLYQNEDAANILWEFAFARIGIHVDANLDGVMNEASVDPNNLDLNNLSEDDKAQLAKSDYVSPERPFRFWLNNDYDVVLESESSFDVFQTWLGFDPGDPVKLSRNTCPPLDEADNVRDQRCIEDDRVIMNGETRVTNSDAEHRDDIESVRDLEDFAPMVIRLDEATYEKTRTGEYTMVLETHNIGINLFRGTWEEEVAEQGQNPLCEGFPGAGDNNTADQPGGVDIRRHMSDCQAALKQVNSPFHVAYLAGTDAEGESQGDSRHTVPFELVSFLFDEDPRRNGFKMNVLFEGVDPCTGNDASECYLQLKLIDSNDGSVVASTKTYMDLQPIKAFYDHFTAGTWIECRDDTRDAEERCDEDPTTRTRDLYTSARNVHAGEADSPKQFHQSVDRLEGGRYQQQWRDQYDYRPLFQRLAGDDTRSEPPPYVMFVHGWRMPYAERVAFAETTFKRMYWQGYTGRFGTFSWPTGWFPKSSNVGTVTTLLEVFSDINNYSRSERIARDTGPVLADKLADIKTDHEVHLLAHSMGNVVASEALKAASGTVLDTYVATQAATAAGAYAPEAAPEMGVDSTGRRGDIDRGDAPLWWLPFELAGDLVNSFSRDDCLGQADFEVVWRCNNLDSDEWLAFDKWYDIPPDWYRNAHAEPRKHPKRTEQRAYYDLIATKVEGDRIFNFFNQADAALDGWNLQQITKPDVGQQVTGGSTSDLLFGDIMWGWDHDPVVQNEQACSDNAVDCEVVDRFRTPEAKDANGNELYDLDWTNRYQRNAILSMILPSRTYALGASEGIDLNQNEIKGDFNLKDGRTGYTNSDFDHSAQWLDSYTEEREYWDELTDRFFEDEGE